jgi:hypothetical protein
MSVRVTGAVTGPVDDNKLYYTAAAPFYKGYSFSGGGLPFHSPSQAFEKGASRGVATVGLGGRFDLEIPHPNSYFARPDAPTPVPPQVRFGWMANGSWRSGVVDLPVSAAPFRSVRRPCTACGFPRSGELKPQDELLLDRAFPSGR